MLYSFLFEAMGSDCILHLYAGNASVAEAAAQSAIAEVHRIEARYSRYRADSLLSQINRSAQSGSAITVDEETAGLLDYAYACYRKSAGLFDISAGVLGQAWDFTIAHLPDPKAIEQLLPLIGLDKVLWQPPRLRFTLPGMALDFGGIGKEYAADRAAAICIAAGVRQGLVDLGGDIQVLGPHPNQTPWRIGIRHPRYPEQAIAEVDIAHGALATSGDYERYIEINGKRYCHILNPSTGWPVHGLSSVSVLAEQCLVAGSVATIAMLKAREGISWLQSLGVQHMWVDEAGNQGGNLLKRTPSQT